MGGAVYSHFAVGLDARVVPAIVLGLLSLGFGYSAGAGARAAGTAAPPQGK